MSESLVYNDEIDELRLLDEGADRLAIGARDELRRVGRKARVDQARAHDLAEGRVRVRRVRATAPTARACCRMAARSASEAPPVLT